MASATTVTDSQPQADTDQNANEDTKEGETRGRRAVNRVVVTCMLPGDMDIASMISGVNTINKETLKEGGEDNTLLFGDLEKFEAVRMNEFWEDVQSTRTPFALDSIKLTKRPGKPNKVSLTFTRGGHVSLTDDEETALDMLMQIPFGGGKFAEARKDDKQEFLSVVLWDWQTKTHHRPNRHFRLQGGRLSLCYK